MYPLLAIRRNAGLRQCYIGFTFRSLIDGYFIIHFLFYSIVYILNSHVALSTSSRCPFCHPFSVCTPSCVYRPVFFPQSLSVCLLPHVSFASSFLFPVFLCCSSCFQLLCSQWFATSCCFCICLCSFFWICPSLSLSVLLLALWIYMDCSII